MLFLILDIHEICDYFKHKSANHVDGKLIKKTTASTFLPSFILKFKYECIIMYINMNRVGTIVLRLFSR